MVQAVCLPLPFFTTILSRRFCDEEDGLFRLLYDEEYSMLVLL
jgi:hypothetical protein